MAVHTGDLPRGEEPPMSTGVSVILPAYNEEENLEKCVNRALEVLPKVSDEYEVLVVNDGSRDDTSGVGWQLVNDHYPRLRLLNHTVNLGYGAAIRTGLHHAKHDLVFYTDADNQFDIGELEHFLPLAETSDLVLGFRVYRYDSVLRSMLSWIYNRLVGVVFRVRVRDVDCAFKLMRREVVEKLTIECTNFFVDTEIVARARKWNFRIVEKGVRHYPRTAGETTVRPSDIPGTLREIARMWRRIYFPTRRQRSEAEAAIAQTEERVVEAVPIPA
jgi:glycosyltransferase involved in cell wall biosynthesis